MKVFVHRQQLNRRISANIRHQISANLNLIDDEYRRLLGKRKMFPFDSKFPHICCRGITPDASLASIGSLPA